MNSQSFVQCNSALVSRIDNQSNHSRLLGFPLNNAPLCPSLRDCRERSDCDSKQDRARVNVDPRKARYLVCFPASTFFSPINCFPLICSVVLLLCLELIALRSATVSFLRRILLLLWYNHSKTTTIAFDFLPMLPLNPDLHKDDKAPDLVWRSDT